MRGLAGPFRVLGSQVKCSGWNHAEVFACLQSSHKYFREKTYLRRFVYAEESECSNVWQIFYYWGDRGKEYGVSIYTEGFRNCSISLKLSQNIKVFKSATLKSLTDGIAAVIQTLLDPEGMKESPGRKSGRANTESEFGLPRLQTWPSSS